MPDSASKPAVVLSTVHKAKGLEWPRVFILSETFRRGKGVEEDNIFYVAVTRAMKALYFVGGNKPQVQESCTSISENKGNTQILPELVKLEVGQIFDMNGRENVVTVVEEDSAIIRHARGERVRLLGNKTKPERIKRQIPVEEIENFLSSSAVFDEELNQIRSEKQQEQNTMKKNPEKKPAAAKALNAEKATQVSYAGRGERIATTRGGDLSACFHRPLSFRRATSKRSSKAMAFGWQTQPANQQVGHVREWFNPKCATLNSFLARCKILPPSRAASPLTGVSFADG